MTEATWAPLRAELDRWAEAGRSVQLWLRDDDAVAPSPALSRLSDLAERFEAPVLLAVIPMLAEPALAAALARMPLLQPCQHGVRHQNHAPPGEKKSEFGAGRSPATVDAGIAEAGLHLRELFGEAPVPIFVPPWNRIAPGHAARLPALGFAGLSCFRGHRLAGTAGLALLDTDLDVMDWQGGRVGRRHEELVAELAALLAHRRSGSGAAGATLGVLLHHRDHDETVWSFLDALLRLARAHPAVRIAEPKALLHGCRGATAPPD